MMKKDTVLLNLEDYNELRDFKKKLEDGYTYTFAEGMWGFSIKFISTDDAIKEMAKKLEEKQKLIDDLKNSFDELKEMNWFEFRNWKQKQIKE